MNNELDSNHVRTRSRLSRGGLIALGLGVPCALIGICLFLSGFFTPSREFFANPNAVMDRDSHRAIIGIVMAAVGGFSSVIGLNLLGFANTGRVARYQAGEVMPLAKDALRDASPVINEMVRGMANAMHDPHATNSAAQGKIRHACGAWNDPDDRFCKGCGAPLQKPTCPKCGGLNDPDARFCEKCGAPLPSSHA
jgi:ribosomal protein L40E